MYDMKLCEKVSCDTRPTFNLQGKVASVCLKNWNNFFKTRTTPLQMKVYVTAVVASWKLFRTFCTPDPEDHTAMCFDEKNHEALAAYENWITANEEMQGQP